MASSLSDLKEIGCKMIWTVHISPVFGAKGTTICLKTVKICPRPAHFSHRFFKSDRLLGKCNREQADHSMHLVFKFNPEADPQSALKLKVEINTREHSHLFGIKSYPFAVDSDWYRGKTEITSFEPEELFCIKLRAPSQSSACWKS